MSFRSDPLAELVVPDGTTVEEHAIVTESDVIVGAQSTVSLGVRGRNVVAGEQVTFEGDIEASSDCRLDMWCDVGGNVLVGEDAYIGERVTIDGQLVVAGDLDIGDDVDIGEGFDANGWIVIRNPVPTLVFLFTYLTHLLRLGEEDLAEDVLSEMFEGHDEQPLIVPTNATVGDDAWRVSTPARVGDDCRLHGNLRAESILVGVDNEIFGSLRARESITVARGTTIHGDVTTRGGSVEIAEGAQIRGDIACEQLRLHEGAVVEGAMRARGEMTVVQDRNRLADGRFGAEGSETADTADATAEATDTTDEANDSGSEPAADAPDATDEKQATNLANAGNDTDGSEVGEGETGGTDAATDDETDGEEASERSKSGESKGSFTSPE